MSIIKKALQKGRSPNINRNLLHVLPLHQSTNKNYVNYNWSTPAEVVDILLLPTTVVGRSI